MSAAPVTANTLPSHVNACLSHVPPRRGEKVPVGAASRDLAEVTLTILQASHVRQRFSVGQGATVWDRRPRVFAACPALLLPSTVFLTCFGADQSRLAGVVGRRLPLEKGPSHPRLRASEGRLDWGADRVRGADGVRGAVPGSPMITVMTAVIVHLSG
jgi:hypothetical protein